MKKIQAIKVRIAVFIVLIILAIVLVVPTHNKLVSIGNSFVNSISRQLEEKTGLKLSYSSLSPSVLSTFSIQNINLYQADDTLVLSIAKTKVNYNLLDLLKKDFQKGIKNVTVDGINLDVEKLVNIISMFTENAQKIDIDYKDLKTKIPNLIKLKNISLKYANNQLEAELLLKEILINNSTKKENLVFSLDSRVFTAFPAVKQKVSCSLAINGTIPDQLENSMIYLYLDDLTNGTYKLSKLNLLAMYTNNRLDVHTIQAVNPISVNASFDLEDGLINAQLKSEKLSPLSVVSSNQKKMKAFSNLLIDTDTQLFCDINSKTITYMSDGQIFIPDNIFPNSLQVDYSLSGDENELDLQYLNASGKNCEAMLNLTYFYKTMQAIGLADVPGYILPNGNVISTELYINPREKGFDIDSPVVFIGSKLLTGLKLSFMPQSDSYDFILEVYDDTHSSGDDSGFIKLDGSYLTKNNYIQSGVALNSLYLDSLIDLYTQISEPGMAAKVEPVKNAVADFMFSGDAYVSTDFKSVSFNIPYVMLANTKKDNQFMLLAANGNEQSLQLNRFSLIFGQYTADATASLDINTDTKDMFFVTDINADSVPYHFSGTIMPEVINVTGDYGTDCEIHFGTNKSLSGHAYFKEIPFSYGGNSIVFSTESDFTYDLENGPQVQIKQLGIEEASARYSVSPKLLMSGNVTKYGAQIDSIAYTDYYSALEGTADVMVNINHGIFDSFGIMMNVKNPLSEEAISMDTTISNPDHVKLDAESIKESLFINTQVLISNFGLNRFTELKNDNNLLTASLSAAGTVNNPYIALGVEDFSILMANNFLHSSGSITLEDKLLMINGLSVDFQNIKSSDITAQFSLETMEGQAFGSVDTDAGGKTIHMPLEISVTDTVLKPGKKIPESTLVTISAKDISGSFVKKPFDFDLSAMYSGGEIGLFSSPNMGLYGSVSSDGSLLISMNSMDKVKASITGVVNKNETNVKIGDVWADLNHICSYFDLEDVLTVENGVLSGTVSILNSFNDPLLKGAMVIEQPVIKLPTIIPQKISAPKTLITIINNELRVHDTEYKVFGSNSANVGCIIYMNKWNVDHLEASVKTSQKGPVAVKMITPAVSVTGEVNCNIKLYMENEVMEVTGNVAGENMNITSDISSIQTLTNTDNSANPVVVRTDLDFLLGNHASVNFEPLLRCVFVPNTHVKVQIDTDANYYNIDGELKIKSGDIAYLNRNFYIKEGNIKFNKTDIANPQVTISAETRERDDEGQNVRIILSAENQYLLNFEPKFSSIPAKSENEIRLLLGQITIADSATAANFLFAAGDYAFQSTVMRKAENKLREVLNFDIFSMRTNVLQNTLNLGVTKNLSWETLTIGNFLDNSTVYVGKYLGSSLYLDAMIHFSFEDTYARDIASAGNLMFQPEFGLEMESPFGNIRWNMAPDINALMNHQFVPSTSVTISWKHTF